jgi:nicotinamide mononucleotide adenylyltransferase
MSDIQNKIPDTNKDNSIYDEITYVPEEDFDSDLKGLTSFQTSGEEQVNYIGPELDESQISPEMFDDSEGAWVDAGTEMLDTDPVDVDSVDTTPTETDINGENTTFDSNTPISREEGLEKIGDALSDMSDEELKFDGNYEVTIEDVKKCVGDSTISSPNFEMSEESALEIVKLINKIRDN